VKSAALMVATRIPTPGETKTRLGSVIGMAAAAHLYEAFLIDLANRLIPAAAASGFDLIWTVSPPEGDLAAVFQDLGILVTSTTTFLPQSGDSWGERQDYLLRWAATRGYERAVLIASDSPHLPVRSISIALEGLRTHDVAIGRVHDGGYYLIGMRGYSDVLLDVPMSTPDAASTLIANARNRQLTWLETDPTFDVDVYDDLPLLIGELDPDGGNCPCTWRRLHELGLR
jgi:glycosyltransferase A (GT-A) superfamily protein (DUF2064 family)